MINCIWVEILMRNLVHKSVFYLFICCFIFCSNFFFLMAQNEEEKMRGLIRQEVVKRLEKIIEKDIEASINLEKYQKRIQNKVRRQIRRQVFRDSKKHAKSKVYGIKKGVVLDGLEDRVENGRGILFESKEELQNAINTFVVQKKNSLINHEKIANNTMRYSWKTITEKYLEIYQELLEVK